MTSTGKTSINDGGRPFLKWAGGKRHLLPFIKSAIPPGIGSRKDLTYIEPFVGSGAVMFWFLKEFSQVKRAVINDKCDRLTNAYQMVKEAPSSLIKALTRLEQEYFQFTTESDRKAYYLEKRKVFNACHLGSVNNAALFMFLNRTCFNGLYRVNGNNRFNVPFGRYTKPRICNPEAILAASTLLQRVAILTGDFEQTLDFATGNTFFYLDPPYKPVSKTSSFNAYAPTRFDDEEQRRLRYFCDKLSTLKFQWLLSNSDPASVDPGVRFFDELYSRESVFVDRIAASRTINSIPSKRGKVSELLISNYAR